MDYIVGVKKLHLVGRDIINKPKQEGGLGIRKFSLMNQAMLTKQYLPNSLQAISWSPKHSNLNTAHLVIFTLISPNHTTHGCGKQSWGKITQL